MLKNYMVITLRHIIKHRSISTINIVGLAVGLACSIMIALYIQQAISYDTFHNKADHMYRLVSEGPYNGPVLQGGFGPLLEEEIPEIQNTVRFYAGKIWGNSAVVSHEDTHFFSENFFLADPTVFDVFDFPLTRGDPETVFSDINSVVITEEMAEKYFGTENPMGQVITYDHTFDFTVTGVLKNIPETSHIHFDFLAPLENYRRIQSSPNGIESWGNSAFFTYLFLSEEADVAHVESQIAAVAERHVPPNRLSALSLQPLLDIHLYSNLYYEFEANGNIQYIYVFSIIAVLIMLIACINYMNLSTARFLNRSKEVGLRKVVGAKRSQLILQFLGESILVSLVAILIAAGLVYAFLPLFNDIAGQHLLFDPMGYPIELIGIAVLCGLVAGSFPALFLSAFTPAHILSGHVKVNKWKSASLRRALVVVQFSISIGLICCAGIIADQMDYIRTKNLGINKDQIVVIPTMRNKEAIRMAPIMADELATIPDVLQVATSSHTPGVRPFYRDLRIIDGNPDVERIDLLSLWIDHDFIETYELELIAGRGLSREFPADIRTAFVINEATVAAGGWASAEEAVGKEVSCDGKTGQIIGVVRDFHFLSLHNAIEPMVMHYNANRFYAVSARIQTDQTSATLAALRDRWETLLPTVPFNYFFLDKQYEQQYQTSEMAGRLLQYFTILAIALSCLGLFGLASFTAEQRTREIGIRKVLGSSVLGIVFLLSKSFTGWVLVGNFIAWPLAYITMDRWLEDFAYRIDIGWWSFILGGSLALGIALVTVGYQAIKAAIENPVEALRYE